ncbi:CDP-alcohol phosphatidyltransferase family protein [Azospirillum sp. SYSU D00513]|uniref:CDP-alcohol phosphatidyltransferase family protein n=1 Tax=Azospirillum sp. SYSU D00513 TaxID=2812561 RepID=UPI001A976904
MSIPNIISFARLLSVPLAVYLILSGDLYWAFWLFVAAGLSDALDGAVARMCRARTVLGGYLDPIADKALLVSVYVALGHVDALPLWLVILVVFRDIMIVGGVLLAYTLKESLAMQPAYISKVNTVVQLVLVTAVLAPAGLGWPLPEMFGTTVMPLLIWLCAATTVASGVAYVYRGGLLFNRHGGVS